MKIRYIVFIFVLALSFKIAQIYSNSYAQTPKQYYVDCSTGSDSNDGLSPSTAWKSMSKASSATFNPGESLLLKSDCTWNSTLTLSESGTSSQNIRVSSYGAGAKPRIKINVLNGSDIDISGSYIRIENLQLGAEIVSTEAGCENNPKGHAVGISFESGASYNTVTNSVLTDGYAGVFLKSGSHNNVITKNEFTDNKMMSPLDTSADNDAGAFGVLIWGDNNDISYNHFSGMDACSYDYVRDGSAVEIYGGQNNNIHHNTATQSDAFTELGNTRSANNKYVYNLFYSNLARSIFLNTRAPIAGTLAYNNSVYLTGASSQGFVCSSCTSSILSFKNNIVMAAGKVGYASSLDESNNIYWLGQRQFPVGGSSKVVDPQFVDVGNNNFHLKSTSPAINAGLTDQTILGYNVDLDNASIPAGSSVDIGVFEYNGQVSTLPTGTSPPSALVGNYLDFFKSWFLNSSPYDFNKDLTVNSFDFALSIKDITKTASPIAIATVKPTITPVPTAKPTTQPTPVSTIKPTTNPTTTPTSAPINTDSILVATVGDINPSGNTSLTSAAGKNAVSIGNAKPNIILGLGDYQYTSGSCSAYLSGFDKIWGNLVSIMYVTAGPTHDWDATNSTGQQYNQYFSGTCPNQTTGPALGLSDPSKPYSFNIGKWHFVQLSSGCWRYSSACSGSAESTWLESDLANAVSSGHPYIVAFWHEPYWTSATSTHPSPTTAVKPWIDILYKYHAKLVLGGHQHGYARFVPQNNSSQSDNAGIQQFIVGTGGIGFYSWSSTASNVATQQTGTYGWLKLVLNSDGSYDWQFVPTSGGTYTDSGSRSAF